MFFFHRSSTFTKNALFFLRSGRIKEAPDSPIAGTADGKWTNAANGGCRQTSPPMLREHFNALPPDQGRSPE